jgi:hypothetical protein
VPFSLEQEWKPTKKQAQFLAIPWTIKEALYGGGAGSGKSELLLMLPIVHGFHKHPEYKQVLMRRTTKQLKKEVVPRSFEIYPRFGGTFNESDMVWTFPRPDQFGSGAKNTGAKVYMAHCENDKDVHIYDSMQINVFSPDEITSLTYQIYTYIALTRVRSSTRDLPSVIRAAGMPGDVGHAFVKARFIDGCPEGGKILLGRGGIKRVFIHATLLDNPYIDPDYISMLNALPEAEKQAKLYGAWDAYLGQVFSEFRDVHYEDEPDNALHLIPEFDIPSWWPKVVAIDWGYNAMCSIGWGAVSPTQRLYVYRHQMFRGKKIEEWAPLVKYYVEKDKPQEIVICHSAAQNRGDPHSIVDQVALALNHPVSLGVRDRISGKTLVHEYLRWKQKEVPIAEQGIYSEERAAWIIRNKGMAEYQQYLRSFDSVWQPEDNLPRLQFFDIPEVKVICDAIKACVYAKDMKDGKKQEDVAEFDGDDPYDMLRMMLHCVDRFFQSAENQQEKLDRLAEIQRKFEQTQDMTSYYRNMARVEAGEAPKATRLFHRAARR